MANKDSRKTMNYIVHLRPPDSQQQFEVEKPKGLEEMMMT
jgi:hypothetical protein